MCAHSQASKRRAIVRHTDMLNDQGNKTRRQGHRDKVASRMEDDRSPAITRRSCPTTRSHGDALS
eukprot:7927993-Alexandrium_andersonii.AAC.1